MRLRTLTSSVATLLMIGFGMAGPASADSENAATVTESSECRDFREGVICSESRWVLQDTVTPSGNRIRTAIGDTSFVYTGSDGCTWANSFTKREHWTVHPGSTQEAFVLQSSETTNTCFGSNVECFHSLTFQFVEGSFRIYKSEGGCTPLP
jgi:hypothetical protein